jgi:hypothetical protein
VAQVRRGVEVNRHKTVRSHDRTTLTIPPKGVHPRDRGCRSLVGLQAGQRLNENAARHNRPSSRSMDIGVGYCLINPFKNRFAAWIDAVPVK